MKIHVWKKRNTIHVFVLSDKNIVLRYSILRCRQWVYFLWHCWRWLYRLRNWQWLRNLIACLHLRPNLYHRFIFNLDYAKLFVKTNIIIYRLFDFLIFFFLPKLGMLEKLDVLWWNPSIIAWKEKLIILFCANRFITTKLYIWNLIFKTL